MMMPAQILEDPDGSPYPPAVQEFFETHQCCQDLLVKALESVWRAGFAEGMK